MKPIARYTASALPPAEDQASIAVTPSVVDAANFLPRPGSHAAVSTFDQPGMTETAATNSLGIVGERCEAFPISAGLAARLSVGSASEGACVRPAGFNFRFDCRGDDPGVLKNIAILRARAKNSISATSSSS
ncbi:hypothetical protein ABIA90_001238 [Bradyrhizobium sp. LA6.8]